MPAKGQLNFRDRTGEIVGDFIVAGHAGTTMYRYARSDTKPLVRVSLWHLLCKKAGHHEVRSAVSINTSKRAGVLRCFTCRGWCRYEPGHKQSHFAKGKENAKEIRAVRAKAT